MPRVVGPRIAASTTHPPPPIAPQARHLVTGRTAVQPSALHLKLHRRTSPRTRPDRLHTLAKPRPVRCLIRRADELLHVNQLMHQHLIAQVEPRAFHGGIAGRPIQQTGNSHHKGRPVRIRTDRPKLPHRGRWQELDLRERQPVAKEFAVKRLRPHLQRGDQGGVRTAQVGAASNADLLPNQPASSLRANSRWPPSRA